MGLQQRREDADCCGLAGPVGSEQTKNRALSDSHVDAVECSDMSEVSDQAFGLDCWGVHKLLFLLPEVVRLRPRRRYKVEDTISRYLSGGGSYADCTDPNVCAVLALCADGFE